MMISIEGLDKAEVLAALYNRAKAQGMGWIHYDPPPMTTEEAQAILSEQSQYRGFECYFDYLKGRVMKVDLGGNEFDPRLYDRDNGEGAAESVIRSLRNASQSRQDDL